MTTPYPEAHRQRLITGMARSLARRHRIAGPVTLSVGDRLTRHALVAARYLRDDDPPPSPAAPAMPVPRRAA